MWIVLPSRYIICSNSVYMYELKDDETEYRGSLTLRNTKVQCSILCGCKCLNIRTDGV